MTNSWFNLFFDGMEAAQVDFGPRSGYGLLPPPGETDGHRQALLIGNDRRGHKTHSGPGSRSVSTRRTERFPSTSDREDDRGLITEIVLAPRRAHPEPP